MAEPFLSEIRICSFNFAPKGWAMCNGQFLPINQNQALFSLLGTTYGGNGQTTFALPDLRGCVPIHFDGGFSIGEKGGQTAHTLSIGELCQHTHPLNVTNDIGTSPNPGTTVILSKSVANSYGPATNLTTMNPGSVTNTGGSQPHNNMQPYFALTF